MLAFDEDIPAKTDSATIPTTTTSTASSTTGADSSNLICCPPSTAAASTTTDGSTVIDIGTNTSATKNTNLGATLNRHIQQKKQYWLGVWDNVQHTANTTLNRTRATPTVSLIKIDRDYSPLFFIGILTLIAIGCSFGALFTNYWACDSSRHFGIWNTCFTSTPAMEWTVINPNPSLSVIPLTENAAIIKKNVQTHAFPAQTNASFILLSNGTSTLASTPNILTTSSVLCAQQTLWDVQVNYAEQSRVDQVSAAKIFIIAGTFFFILSFLAIAFAYTYGRLGATISGTTKKLNSVRNALAIAVCVQILSFVFMLIGFFLFINTERVSTSVSVLFFYFLAAIIATNIINFVTIDYKTFKSRNVISSN